MSSGGWWFIFVERGFGFAAQSEDHADQVWAVGVIVRECFEFGDEGLEGGGFRPCLELHRCNSGARRRWPVRVSNQLLVGDSGRHEWLAKEKAADRGPPPE